MLRSSSLRLEEQELRTEDRRSQLLHDRLQPLNLKKVTRNKEELIALGQTELEADVMHLQSLAGGLDHWQQPQESLLGSRVLPQVKQGQIFV